jgi:riboflavin kinase/FMN adenylyltransferase
MFTREVAAMTAEAFMDNLRAHFNIHGLVVGADFSLGHNRMGNVAFLEQYGQKHDILVRSISLEEAEKTRISSTRIRALVNEGDIAEANELLGHPVIASGIVRHGDRRGRLIGFPTANLLPDPHKLLPADGVYAVHVRVPDETGSDSKATSTVYNGVANLGVRPTFDGKERLVEAHLLDVDLDLYDKYITVEFIAHLRGEQRFPGIDALKAQISSDAQQARQILATRRVST